MRGRMNERKSYAPPVQIGEVMVGGTVGRVEQSNDPNFQSGDIVVGNTGWQDYAVAKARDLHKLDICVASPETGEVTTLIEDRMNTYIETKPLRLINNGEEMLYWSERDGWGHWYLYDSKGALKNQVTSGAVIPVYGRA